MMNYLVLHGLGGSADGHWQEWLSMQLKANGQKVWFPQFSNWDHPVRSVWLNQLEETLSAIPGDQPLTVVAHSLGCILWLQYAAQSHSRRIDRLILVCPPSKESAVDEIQDFFPLCEDNQLLQNSAEKALLVLSTDDPYLPLSQIGQYLAYKVPCLILPKKGHINKLSGFGAWPWILDCCLHAKNKFPILPL